MKSFRDVAELLRQCPHGARMIYPDAFRVIVACPPCSQYGVDQLRYLPDALRHMHDEHGYQGEVLDGFLIKALGLRGQVSPANRDE